MVQIKRAYEPPTRRDGRRILVERLWPRGVKKEALAADAWMKEVAPSTELRKWFGHEVEKWPEFQRRYTAELDGNPAAWQPLLAASRTGTVTLLFAAHDVDHNSAAVLRDYLAARSDRPAPRRKPAPRRRPNRPTLATDRITRRPG
jgi:uncharacterized protein YeaO (DUF488 family)